MLRCNEIQRVLLGRHTQDHSVTRHSQGFLYDPRPFIDRSLANTAIPNTAAMVYFFFFFLCAINQCPNNKIAFVTFIDCYFVHPGGDQQQRESQWWSLYDRPIMWYMSWSTHTVHCVVCPCPVLMSSARVLATDGSLKGPSLYSLVRMFVLSSAAGWMAICPKSIKTNTIRHQFPFSLLLLSVSWSPLGHQPSSNQHCCWMACSHHHQRGKTLSFHYINGTRSISFAL